MTVVEHHSVGELQELFRREKDARWRSGFGSYGRLGRD